MSAVSDSLRSGSRARWWEFAIWLLLLVLPLLLPKHSLLISEITIIALFAMSLDLVLGYSGIVSLGHAAFFGAGAYAAALFAKHINPNPLTGLVFATALTAVLGLVCSPGILRGSDLTRLMVTLGIALILQELANKMDHITGGAEAKSFQPMNVNFGLFPPLPDAAGGRKGRKDRYRLYTDRAKADWTAWLGTGARAAAE